jgi:hypothetical protein
MLPPPFVSQHWETPSSSRRPSSLRSSYYLASTTTCANQCSSKPCRPPDSEPTTQGLELENWTNSAGTLEVQHETPEGVPEI